jgi:hypothetical protein
VNIVMRMRICFFSLTLDVVSLSRSPRIIEFTIAEIQWYVKKIADSIFEISSISSDE